MPIAGGYTSAVWDGQNAYVFGGVNNDFFWSNITQYSPSNDSVQVVAQLTSARYYTSAVWDGQNADIFGGQILSSLPQLNEIEQFNPTTETVSVATATLPTGITATTAVWDGQYAYIFGGANDAGISDQIVQYNPATQKVTVMGATLPVTTHAASSIYDGHNA